MKFSDALAPVKNRWVTKDALVLAGGSISALAFPPLGSGAWQPVALAALWLGVRGTTWATAGRHGLLFGLSFFLIHLFWLIDSIGPVAWLLLSLVQAGFFVAVAIGLRWVSDLPLAPLWGAAWWASIETLRSVWPLGGLPWGRLGYSAVDTAWDAALPLVGVSGTGFLVALLGFAAAELTAQLSTGAPDKKLAVKVAAAGLWLIAVLSVSMPQPEPDGTTLRVAVVQGGVPGDGTELVRYHREVTLNHVRATEELAAALKQNDGTVDLVVWPENSTAIDPRADPATEAAIDRAARALGAPIFVGGISDGPTPETAYNRSQMWYPRGSAVPEVITTYTKRHLVPFGEYLPWRETINGWSSRFNLIRRDMLPGRSDQAPRLGAVRFAAAICFDVAYDDVIPQQVLAGARFVTVQTSNATFFGTPQLDQQLGITRARALEVGRTIVVASTNGMTAVISADGGVEQLAPRGTSASLIAEIQLRSELTPATRWQFVREVVIWTAGSLGLVLAGARRWRLVRSAGPTR